LILLEARICSFFILEFDFRRVEFIQTRLVAFE